MLKINGKTFMNIQEAVQWLLDNNALPFQSSANYVANTEIGMGTIVNPSPAKVRIGSMIFFADSKVSTVIGITENGFICSDQYNNLVDDVAYVTNVAINASGHLITTMSDGQTIDAGLIKQVVSFSINSSQHLIVTYNDGSTSDLGAIFSGSITISGNLTVIGTVNQQTYELDQDITISNLPSGLTSYYAHARISNGKLNIVIGLGNSAGDAVVGATGNLIGELVLSETILSKLYPFVSNILYTKALTLDTASAIPFASSGYTCLRVDKEAGKLSFRLSQNTLEASTSTRVCRFEVNFIL